MTLFDECDYSAHVVHKEKPYHLSEIFSGDETTNHFGVMTNKNTYAKKGGPHSR
jgi:hypothetical protein